MKCYLIWAVDLPAETNTTDRTRYLQRFPSAPKYGPFYLFPANHEEVAGLTCDVVDLSGKTLIHSVADNDCEMTFDSFNALANDLINEGFSGRCIVLSVQQGEYLHATRYSDEN